MIPFTRQAVAVAAVAGTIVAGTGVGASAATHRGRASVRLHATSRHHVVAPSTLRPGVVHLRNTNWRPVYVFAKRHKGVARLATDLDRAARSAGPGRLTTDFTTLDLLNGRSDAYLRLARGSYFLVDATLLKYKRSEVRTVTVTGTRIDAKLPAFTRIAVDAGNVLHAPATLPRRGYLHVANRASRLQELLMVRLTKDASDESVTTFLADPHLRDLFRLDLDLTVFEVPGILSGRHAVYVHQHFKAGRYLLLTLAFGRHTRTPHLMTGRVRLVTVT